MNFKKLIITLSFLLLAVFLMFSSVNKSVTIPDGKKIDSLSSVNGSLTLGDNCSVDGSVTNVNGSIYIGKGTSVKGVVKNVNGGIRLYGNCVARDVKSVNGGIKLGENSTINGLIKSVNGSIRIKDGSKIADGIRTVNGSIKISKTRLGDGITTVNGSITITNKSVVKGNILIKESNRNFLGLFKSSRHPKVKIRVSGNSVIDGDIINEDKDFDVILIIEDGSKVTGKKINIKT